MNKLLILLLIFSVQLDAAQAKTIAKPQLIQVAPAAAAQAAFEVKVQAEHLKAAKFFANNDPVQVRQIQEVKELLRQNLPVQNGNSCYSVKNKMPLEDLIYDYTQSEYKLESEWDLDKLPISQRLTDCIFPMPFVYQGHFLGCTFVDGIFQVLYKFKGHDERPGLFCIGQDRVVTYVDNIKVWKKFKNEIFLQYQLSGHEDIINCAIQLNDKDLASGSMDKTIRIWRETASGQWKCVQVLRKQNEEISDLIAVGDSLVSGSKDGSLCLWQKNAENQWECKDLKEHVAGGSYFHLMHDNTFASCIDNDVIIWKINGQKLEETQRIDAESPFILFQGHSGYRFAQYKSEVFYNYLFIDTLMGLNLYEKINDRWEFVACLSGHTQEKNLPFLCSYRQFSDDQTVIILSCEEIENKTKYKNYLIFWQKNNLGEWVKIKQIYVGESKDTGVRFDVIYDKVIVNIDNKLLVYAPASDTIDFANVKTYKVEDLAQGQQQAQAGQPQAQQLAVLVEQPKIKSKDSQCCVIL